MIRCSLILCITAAVLLLASCSSSDRSPAERAAELSSRAGEALSASDHEEAERLLRESIQLRAEAGDNNGLADDYGTLASIQVLTGRLSPALETLASLRILHQRTGDRAAELKTMVETGRIAARLGRTSDAVTILSEAYSSGKLLQQEHDAAAAAIELAAIAAANKNYDRASEWASSAALLAAGRTSGAVSVEALTQLVSARAAAGDGPGAFDAYRQAAALLLKEPTLDRIPFLLSTGESFGTLEEWSFARDRLHDAMELAKLRSSDLARRQVIRALISLGSLFERQYDYPEAIARYQQALALLTPEDLSVRPVLLLNIADALLKRASSGSQEDWIRTQQFLEQSLALFTRLEDADGEAEALYRLGRLRERQGDANAAITYYKRAFDRCEDRVPPSRKEWTSASGVEDLSIAFSIARDLISLLLQNGRTEEAYRYLQAARTASVRSVLLRSPVRFHDQRIAQRASDVRRSFEEYQQTLTELQEVAARTGASQNDRSRLKQQSSYLRSKVQADAVSLAGDHPQFSFLTVTPTASLQPLQQAVPDGAVLVEYFLGLNEAWAFLLRNDAGVTAVKLSNFGLALKKKMSDFEHRTETGTSAGISSLASDLSSLLIAPLGDLTGKQLIIVPPVGMEFFPFHALLQENQTIGERNGIAYLPHASFLLSRPKFPALISTVTAIGYSGDPRRGLEFELRDIRSFFRNTTVATEQSATPARLSSASGDVLQLSVPFTPDPDGGGRFTLSDGTSTRTGTTLPEAAIAAASPFPLLMAMNTGNTPEGMTEAAPLLALLNGSCCVITANAPVSPEVSRSFTEGIYASLSTDPSPFIAYRRAYGAIAKRKEWNGGFAGAAYRFYGVP